MTQLDRLLDLSISQHGYWLVNHRSIIMGDLMDLLNKQGVQQAILTLDDIDGPFVKNLYKKIEGAKA